MLPFSYVHDHLKPALELLRRDLLARADIDMLNESLTARDKDLELLLSVTGSHPQASGADDLQSLLANAAGHLKCVLAGIVVPDKGLVLTHPENGDVSILTRTQKQLLAITQTRRDPLVINRIATQAGQVAIPYRILACPLRQGSGRTSGVLALFRKLEAPEFIGRDVHLADLLARRVAASIETSYDTLSGLLTRAALEQRVKLMFSEGDRARPALEPAVRRHRRAARHQRKLRHARRRPGHRADRRPAAQASAAEFGGGAHLRRSLRGRHALGNRRGRDVRRRPARRRHAPAHRRRRRALPSVYQPRRHAVTAAATAISAVRSPKPSPPARRPRTAAAIASRPSRKTTSASFAVSPTSTSPPTCAPRSPKIACGSKRR